MFFGKYMCADSSIAITPKSIIDKNIADLDNHRKPTTPDFGVSFFRILLYHANNLYQYN
jgi:hypothetical protein